MRFLSFSQPWLWSITDLPDPTAKRIENRKWMPSIRMIGQRIALHAAKSWDDNAIPFFIHHGIDHPARRELYEVSAIVAVATIDRIVSEARTLPDDQRRWFFGPYGWVFVDVRRLPEPIAMAGAQGLRELAPDVTAMIESQLR